VEVVASLSQGRTAAAQCGLFTYKSVPVIFEPPCIILQYTGCISCFRITQGTYNITVHKLMLQDEEIFKNSREWKKDECKFSSSDRF